MALGALPSLLFGPFAGALIDRHARRPFLIVADWGRAALLITLPIAHALGQLQIELLFVVAFGIGILNLIFDVAYRSFLPSLIERNQLVEDNSKLELSRSAGEVAGPGIGGILIQVASAPAALIVDSVSFVISALAFHSIKNAEQAPVSAAPENSLFAEAVDGVKSVWGHSLLRPLVVSAFLIGLFNALFEAVALLYMTSNLELNAGLIGLTFAVGGIGAIFGAIVAQRVTQRLGVGPAIIGSMVLAAGADLVTPLVAGDVVVIVVLLSGAHIVFGISLIIWNITQVSVRQAAIPLHKQGRMNSTFRLALVGSIFVGALLGGFLGEMLGLRAALFIAVAGELSAAVFLLVSPVRSLKSLPDSNQPS